MEGFNKDLNKWTNLQETIADLMKEIKPLEEKLKKTKEIGKHYEDKILRYMEQNNLTGKKIELGDDMLFCQKSQSTGGVSRDLVEKRLTEFLKDNKMAKKATEYIYNGRIKNEKLSLKKKAIKKNK